MKKDFLIFMSTNCAKYVRGIFPLIGAGCTCSAYQQPRRERVTKLNLGDSLYDCKLFNISMMCSLIEKQK